MAFQADTPLTATAVITAAASIALASLVWWRRLRRLERLRRQVSGVRALSREVARGADASSFALAIQDSLRKIFENPALKASILQPGDGAPAEIPAENCLAFPLNPDDRMRGVLVIRQPGEDGFHEEIRDALADLALHAGIALELREQRRLREQAARGEQLAASSLLLAGIARELMPLLEGILREARQLRHDGITADAESALGLVERLADFGERELARPTLFDLSDVLRELAALRGHAWRLMQVDVVTRFPEQPLPVRAPRGIVEEAALGLIVAAEQMLPRESPARFALEAESRGDHAVLSLALSTNLPGAAAASSSFAACRSLVDICGGRLEFSESGGQLRLEVLLPLAAQEPLRQSRHQPAAPPRQLTLLLVHPDADALRPLVRALADRNHRVVPAADPVQALEMAARLNFDAVFACLAPQDLEWPEFASRIRQHAPAVGWLSSASRPAPPGVPFLPLHPSDGFLDEQLATIAGTGRPPQSSIPK